MAKVMIYGPGIEYKRPIVAPIRKGATTVEQIKKLVQLKTGYKTGTFYCTTKYEGIRMRMYKEDLVREWRTKGDGGSPILEIKVFRSTQY